MTARFCLWHLNSGRGWRISVGRSPVVIRIGPVSWVGEVVVIIVAGKADEAFAEVVASGVIVISVAIVSSVVETAAHAGTVKVVRTVVAEERFSVSS
jgi:hypothetical protein